MKCLLNAVLAVAIVSFLAGCNTQPKSTDDLASKGWKLVWSDEFDYTGLPDSTKWSYDIGGHGWGNQEREYYTGSRLENARVENGVLIIEARKEKMDTNQYTSARLISKGKQEWTYGRFEIRAKLPKGVGTWPAIWMMPAKQSYSDAFWPDNGEIDIMEHVGFNPGFIHASTHCKKYNWPAGTQRTDTIFMKDVSDAFHNYILEWGPDTMQIFLDDKLYFTSTNDRTGWEAWPFDKPFYLILNIAIGGGWGGQKGIDDSIWPQRMELEYVRVYEK
ncbi:MAG TPA: glycoside hydrolase family 16 protein [Bacteroidales bacterium]|nr:glycoside hydrolase family 16 protein [Bacteroidales bacterium]